MQLKNNAKKNTSKEQKNSNLGDFMIFTKKKISETFLQLSFKNNYI